MCGVKYANGHAHTPIHLHGQKPMQSHTLIRIYKYSYSATHTHTPAHTHTHTHTHGLRAYFAFRTGDDGGHGLVRERERVMVKVRIRE